MTLEKELYERARGIEFLFRLGGSLQLPTTAMLTAATWFHRFYMRYSMEDYHRHDVAAACIFLATKTEECGRKLRDVARVFCSKITGIEVAQLTPENPEVEKCQSAILWTEEILLGALCFDFVVDNCHAELVDLFDSHDDDILVHDYAWSIAHDSYRTPLCLLYPPRIIATACYVLAQRIVEGPHSPSLDARISFEPPSASLPTPPSHKPTSPDASRFAIEHFSLGQGELGQVADSLRILLEFYNSQDVQGNMDYLSPIISTLPPTVPDSCFRFYNPFGYTVAVVSVATAAVNGASTDTITSIHGRTPSSNHGGNTPAKTPTQGKGDAAQMKDSSNTMGDKKAIPKLDLS